MEDEKTRPVKAVQRKVSDVATRKVKAVKRAPKPTEPEPQEDEFAGLLALQQVDVLRRAGLVNRGGNHDEGWVFREYGERTDLAWFAGSDESISATLQRWMDQRGAAFDVMCGGAHLAVLQLRPLKRDRSGGGWLRDPSGAQLAALEVNVHDESVTCTTDEGATLILEQTHPSQADLTSGRRSLGRLMRVAQPGILLTTYDLELTFDRQATGFERLCGAAMVVLQDAYRLTPRDAPREDRLDFWD